MSASFTLIPGEGRSTTLRLGDETERVWHVTLTRARERRLSRNWQLPHRANRWGRVSRARAPRSAAEECAN